MERVSGWYKRRSQIYIIIIALLACTMLNVDTIAIASLETDDLHNEKKSRSYELVTLRYDMYDLMKSNAPPQRRLHLSRQVDDGKTFWKLRKLWEGDEEKDCVIDVDVVIDSYILAAETKIYGI